MRVTCRPRATARFEQRNIPACANIISYL